MPSFLDSCENYYGTKDLYKLLQLEKDASQEEVKKAYRRLSLLVHPDRVSEEDKENATEKFKILGKAYSVLSDKEKRAVYDETGSVDDEDGDLQERDWSAYWKLIFKEITFDDISEFEKTYKNSETEIEDLAKAYTDGKGCLDYIFEYVPFTSPDEEDRIRGILQDLIEKGELKSYRAFTHEPSAKREARKRKWAKEIKAAEKARKEITKKKSKQVENESDETDLVKAIMQRKKEREGAADALFKRLEEKYCKPNGRKAKK